jgi:thymidylate synthase
MNTLDKKYQELLQDILDTGVTKSDRTGTGTLSVFGRQIRHKMSEGFPLLTTKKMYFKGIVTELLWFLRGDTNIEFLHDNDCHIWDGDYAKSGRKDGDLGPIYGKQWRSWETYDFSIDNDFGNNEFGGGWNVKHIDQIANSIHLLKTDPDSRRNRVNSWNVGELDQMILPPCHTDFQFFTRELSLEERVSIWDKKFLDSVKPEESMDNLDLDHDNIPTRAISLMWNQRSVDTFLGLPFNIASYGLLLEIIAKEVNMVPDELIGNLGDTHLYLNHIEQAKEQIGRELSLDERKKLYENEFTPGMEVKKDEWLESKLTTREIPKRTREPYPLPKLDIHPGMLDYELDKLEIDMFKILDYQSHPHIKAPLSN